MNRPGGCLSLLQMSRVPVLREMVSAMGAFPLNAALAKGKRSFFSSPLNAAIKAGLLGFFFPRAAQPMVPGQSGPTAQPIQRVLPSGLEGPVQIWPSCRLQSFQPKKKRHNLAPGSSFSALFESHRTPFNCGGWAFPRSSITPAFQLLFGYPLLSMRLLRKHYRGRHGVSLAKERNPPCPGSRLAVLQSAR